MKKFGFLFLLFAVFVFSSAPVWACEGPGCTDLDAGGYIDGGQNQWQSDSQWRFDDTNMVSSNFSMNQYDWAHGEGTNGFTGDIAMGQVQGREFDTTVELGSGAYARSWGSGVQSDFKEATLTERCTLDATGGQHFNSSIFTDQANSGDYHFMNGNQYVNAGANVSLQGGRYGTGAEMSQSAITGYEQVDKSGNWQNGFVAISTNLNVPARTAPPQD